MDNRSTKVSERLQQDLAEYGLLRSEVNENVRAGSGELFGFDRTFGGYKTKFGTSVSAIQDANMMVAVSAPENEPFDMLVTKDFRKAVSTASPDDLRAFLRKIVDRV